MITNSYIMSEETEQKIDTVCDNLKAMLKSKNRKYGDSAISPINIFARDNAGGSILVRIDDKLSRIKNTSTLDRDDVTDLMGYLVLLSIFMGWTEYELGTEKLEND